MRFIDPDGMLEDNFIFNQDNKLMSYENNDEPDKVYVINTKKEPDDPDKVSLKQVNYSSEKVEGLMNDNGFKKVTDKETVEVKEITCYYTDANGSNNEVSKSSTDQKVLDTKTKYVEKEKNVQSVKTDYMSNLDRKHDGSVMIETNVVKRTYDYDKKDNSDKVQTAVNFILKIINTFQ